MSITKVLAQRFEQEPQTGVHEGWRCVIRRELMEDLFAEVTISTIRFLWQGFHIELVEQTVTFADQSDTSSASTIAQLWSPAEATACGAGAQLDFRPGQPWRLAPCLWRLRVHCLRGMTQKNCFKLKAGILNSNLCDDTR